ncbi:MAG: LysR family transcriptional regulator [Brachymonas sp.]|nr:LysR family transcriptional regulator [Brachymonas sp.]
MNPSERSFARRLDLTTLQLFAAVCEHGSIGKAADKEFIAASAVSKRLSDLEAAAGTALLYRHARGVNPTPAGEAFLHHARSVLLSLDRMQGDLVEYAEGIKGHVRIHANISAIVEFLPEDIGAFAKKHSKIKIDLQEHLSGDIIRAVHDGAADIGICNPQADLKGLAVERYRQDRLVLVCPKRHALSRRKQIDFVESLDFDHVGLHSNSALYLAQRRAAADVGKLLQLRIQVTSLDAMCRMIDNGLGVGVMPDRAFELVGSVGDLVAVPLTDAWALRDLLIVARDFLALPAPAKLLVDHLLSKT